MDSELYDVILIKNYEAEHFDQLHSNKYWNLELLTCYEQPRWLSSIGEKALASIRIIVTFAGHFFSTVLINI